VLTLDDAPGEAAFRAEVRRWVAALPGDLRGASRYEDLLRVDRLLGQAGLLGICWPSEYGGRGAPPSHETVLTEELGEAGINRAEAPSHQGVNNLAPALIAHGDAAQKTRHLPRILGVAELWCQGFSEPEAGSDLANVRTTATLEGDGYVVRGSKIWTSGAERADWMYALVRTGPVQERHRSLGFLLIPMDSKGIDIRPIRQITGESEFSEVFLDDVRVPADGLVGGNRDGWRVALTVLNSERLSGRFRYSKFKAELARLVSDVCASKVGGGESFERTIGRLAAEIEGMGSIALRVDSDRAAERVGDGLASINKLWWPQAHQNLCEAALALCTEWRVDSSYWYRTWLAARAESIFGGTAQIQRNIIAERHLGMPRLSQQPFAPDN